MLKRGPRNTQRRNARNYTDKQAQKRLDETVPAFNKQVQNALNVDAVQVVLYQVNRLVGKPCTCSKLHKSFAAQGADADPNAVNPVMPVVPNPYMEDDGLEFDVQDDDIFGTGFGDKIMNDDVYAVDVSGGTPVDKSLVGIEQQDDYEFEDGLASGSINCGICYRTLRVPGYKPYGMHRVLLTSYDVESIDGYAADTGSAPLAFKKQAGDGRMGFRLSVPKYFVSCTYSIRDNLYILKERAVRKDGQPLSMADLKRMAGKEIEIYVQSDSFTHVLFEFDLGVPRLNCNIGGENTTLDYDRLQTMSDIPIVLGPEVSDVNEGDIVCIPERGLYMKVRDKERKITSKQRRLEWVCSTRVLQPTEPLRNISKGYKLR